MKTVEVPEVVYNELFSRAQESRRMLTDEVVELLLNSLEEGRRFNLLIALSEEYSSLAEELREKGDLVGSGEAYWRSLSYLMRAVGMKYGLEVTTYHDHYALAEWLAYKLNDGDFVKLFVNAERLHGEFHPRPQSGEQFKFRVESLKALKAKLEALLEEKVSSD